jgi:hypothetical protein
MMRAGMAVGQFGRARDERHVQPVGAKLHDRFAGRAFGDFDFDAGVVFAVLADQLCEEAARNQGMDTDAKPAAFSGCRHAGGLHRMVELIDAGRDPLDEEASGLGQPDAARMTLEQEDAEVFSSAFTRALTLDCATPSALAAWRKLRYSATARV